MFPPNTCSAVSEEFSLRVQPFRSQKREKRGKASILNLCRAVGCTPVYPISPIIMVQWKITLNERKLID